MASVRVPVTPKRSSMKKDRPTRSSFSSIPIDRERIAAQAKRHSRQPRASSFSLVVDLQRAQNSLIFSDERIQARRSWVGAKPSSSPSSTSTLSPAPLLAKRGSLTSPHQQQQQRSSICSRVSSLTRDSSSRSLDSRRIDVADLTHMVGRTDEVELMAAAFVRAIQTNAPRTREMVMVRGKAGTGKTALVMDFRDSVTNTGTGFFCSGKFQQYQSVPRPFSAILQALNCLCDTLCAQKGRDRWRQSLYASMDHAGLQELTRILPKLKPLLQGSVNAEVDDEDSDFSGPARHTHTWDKDKHEIPRKLGCFLSALSICDPALPIIMFLDDLQWADEDSLDCISALLCDEMLTNLMFIGAYRDDPSCDLPFLSHDHGYNMTDITVDNLTFSNVGEILSDFTGSTSVMELAKIIFDETQGNPNSIFEFIEMLQLKELMVFSYQTHKWSWDVGKIRERIEAAPVVGSEQVQKIDRVSKDSRKLLALAAVIGFSFDPKVLEMISIHLELLEYEFRQHLSNTMKSAIQDAVSGGLIHPDQSQAVLATQMEIMEDSSDASLRSAFYNETIEAAIHEGEVEGLISKAASRSRYKFSHDLVHRTLYSDASLLTNREKLHLCIGRVLRSFYFARKADDMLFATVDHMNRGSTSVDCDEERIDLVGLNVLSSVKAKEKSALFSAADFCKKAINLIKIEQDWQNHYELLLQVFTAAASLNLSCGRFDSCLRYCQEVDRHARNEMERFQINYVSIQGLYYQEKKEQAVALCLRCLSNLGESLERMPRRSQIRTTWLLSKTMMKTSTSEYWRNLPPLKDPIKKEVLHLLSLLATILFNSAPDDMLPMVLLHMLQYTIQHGSCEFTPFAVAGYGMLCTMFGSLEDAYKYGSQALLLCDQIKGCAAVPGTYFLVYSFLDHLQNPLIGGVEPLLKGYRVGVGNGEIQLAATCVAASAAVAFHCALPLKSYTEDLRSTCDQLRVLKQDVTWSLVAPYLQGALSLTKENKEGELLSPEDIRRIGASESTEMPGAQASFVFHNYYLVSFVCSYILNDYESACRAISEMKECNRGGPLGLCFIVYLEQFFAGLLDVALYRISGKWGSWRRAKAVLKEMRSLVKAGVVNCQGMLHLLKAELRSTGRGFEAAKKHYDDAARVFLEMGLVHFHAVANERAGECMERKGKSELAETYYRTAARSYSEWGATAKIEQLKKLGRIPGSKATGAFPCPVITIRGGDSEEVGPFEERPVSEDLDEALVD